MQASLARWAVVTFCSLGAVGCQGTSNWWPGSKKTPAYSTSSSTPPAGVQQYSQQQAYSQQQGYSQQQPGYTQTPGYMDGASYNQAGAQGATNGYQTAGGYPIGSANPQAPYGMAATGSTPATNAYDHSYAQQQPAGAYPEQYPSGATGMSQAGGATGGYAGQATGYQQAGTNSYGGAASTAGYDQTRTADNRYQAGGATGYGANSPYDASGYGGGYSAQDPYSQTGAAPGYQQAPAQTEPYQPGNTGYQPGNTGYNPPGATPYQSPAGAYNPAPNPTSQADPHYRPGSTSDYLPNGATGTAATASTGYGAAPTGATATTGATAAPAYPQTSAATNSYPTQQPAVGRYGEPIQESAGGYTGSMQR